MPNQFIQDPNFQNQPQYIESNQPVQADEIYANVLQEERIRNVLTQLSPDNILLEAHWKIRGYIKNPVTQQWEKLNKNQIEPDPRLISDLMGVLSSIVNQSTTMSNLSIDEINSIMKAQIRWYIDYVDSHAKTFGIEGNYSEMSRIGYVLHTYSFMALKRAMGGTESRRIFNSLSMMDNLAQNQPQKKGMWDAIKSTFMNTQ